jgi:hypothetical protein
MQSQASGGKRITKPAPAGASNNSIIAGRCLDCATTWLRST